MLCLSPDPGAGLGRGTHALYATAFYTNELGDGYGNPEVWKRVGLPLKLTTSASATSPTVAWLHNEIATWGMDPPWYWYVGCAPTLGPAGANARLYVIRDDNSTVYAFYRSNGNAAGSIAAPSEPSHAVSTSFRTAAITSTGEFVVGGQSVKVYSADLSSTSRTISVDGARIPMIDNGSTAPIYYTNGGSVGVIRTDNTTSTTSNVNAHEPAVPVTATRYVVAKSNGLVLLGSN